MQTENVALITITNFCDFSNKWNSDHRGISLNILSYYLVFLDIVILNIFTIAQYCCLSCF